MSSLQDWISKINAKCKAENRHIVLTLDNAPTHILVDVTKKVLHGFDVYYLSNVVLVFLPANTTSIVQPLDQGIIAAFKASYRRYLVRDTIDRVDRDTNLSIANIRPDMLTVVKWVRTACKSLAPDTIRNCWYKAGILGTDKVPTPPPRSMRRRIARHGHPMVQGVQAGGDMFSEEEEEAEEEELELDGGELAALQADLDDLSVAVQRRPGMLEQGDGIVTAAVFGHLSGEEETFEELTEDEIVQLVLSDQQDGLADEDDADRLYERPSISLNECARKLDSLSIDLADHLCFTYDDAEMLMELAQRTRRVAVQESKQTGLYNYYAPL